ncbi:hypothetical protein [Paenibacillus zanthoxyli]|uniref:hypothetical protein n=1 Tax=Paenibacillus zanthoxyli TaxID=369399 RepID=UPI001E32C226|nr:hypothetical protein [Paenibacillus zanthoxyli]
MAVAPVAIVLSILLVHSVILTVGSSEGEQFNGSIVTLYIYSFVFSILLVGQTLPFAVGMNVRRGDYFMGTAIFVGVISVLSALAQTFFAFVEKEWANYWGSRLHFFHFPYLSDGNVLKQFIVILLTLLMFNVWGFFLGSLHCRFRARGVMIFFAALLVIIGVFFSLPGWYPRLDAVGDWLYVRTAFELALWQIPVIILLGAASRVLLRKAEV